MVAQIDDSDGPRLQHRHCDPTRTNLGSTCSAQPCCCSCCLLHLFCTLPRLTDRVVLFVSAHCSTCFSGAGKPCLHHRKVLGGAALTIKYNCFCMYNTHAVIMQPHVITLGMQSSSESVIVRCNMQWLRRQQSEELYQVLQECSLPAQHHVYNDRAHAGFVTDWTDSQSDLQVTLAAGVLCRLQA